MLPYTFVARPRLTAAYPPYALPPKSTSARRLYTIDVTAIAAAAGGALTNSLVRAAAPLDAEPAGQDSGSVSFWMQAGAVSNVSSRVDLALLFSNGAREDLVFLQPIDGPGPDISDADLGVSIGAGPANPTARTVYTASGAIALTDTLAVLDAASGTLAMTLAPGLADGHAVLIKMRGAADATVTGPIDYVASNSMQLSGGAPASGTLMDALRLRWSEADATWLAE